MLKKALFLNLTIFLITIIFASYSCAEAAEQPLAAVASSIEGPEFEAANAIDNNFSTRWSSQFNDDDEWIYIDLGAPKIFNTVILSWETAYGRAYEIQISNDAVDWTTVYTESAGDGRVDRIYVGDQAARYVKMRGLQKGTSWSYSLWEFVVDNLPPVPVREVVSLNGAWQLEPSDTQPAVFNHTVSVPCLIDSAMPSITNWQSYNYFWYKKTFTLMPSHAHSRAFIKIDQSQYGTEVWLNGAHLGSYIGCYTSHKYDATDAINYNGENILLVKVGAKNTLPPESAAGQDFEKISFIPGIWGDTSLILAENPTIERVQLIPHIDTFTAEARITINNRENIIRNITISNRVFERSTGNPSSDEIIADCTILPLEEKTLTVNIPVSNMQLWSPDSPFLYKLVSKIRKDVMELDDLTTTFGMREFKIVGSDFYLNGHRAFLKGGNIAFHRFLSDPDRKELPWNEAWIKKILIDIPKANNFNFFRNHLGQMYNRWYEIADEYGIMLQDEWPFWYANGAENQIRQEFTQWLYDNWNHPSIIIWDALNESHNNVVENIIIPEMKLIDPTRPWEPVDFFEDHAYIYSLGPVLNSIDSPFSRSLDGIKNSATPTDLNEFVWFWLDKNGMPTWLTQQVVLRWLGKNSTPQQRFEHQAFIATESVELYRRIGVDAIAPFVYLSIEDAYTSNWFTGDIANPGVKPVMSALKDAYAPFGVSIELWDRHFLPAENRPVNVYIFNDTTQTKSGTLNYKITSEDDLQVFFEGSLDVTVPATDMRIEPIDWIMPSTTGTYLLKAELVEDSNVVATSKKIAHVYSPTMPNNLSFAKVMVYDPDNEILNYLSSLGLNAVTYNSAGLTQQDILILGEGALLDTDYISRMQEITNFVKQGHSLIVIEPSYGITNYEKQEYPLLSGLSIRMAKQTDEWANGYDSYCFQEDPDFLLWDNISAEHLKMFNGGFGAEMVSGDDVEYQDRKLVLAKSGHNLKRSDVVESISGDGVVVMSRIQIRGRLIEDADPGTDLYSRRVDPVAQQYLLNLLSTYLDTANNRQRINPVLETLSFYVKEITASSVEGDRPEFGPEAVTDGQTWTRWSSRCGDPQWITLDLGRPLKFNKVKLNWETAYASSYKIQISCDGTNWTDIYSTETGNGGIDEVNLDTAVTARYVRMYGSSRRFDAYGYSLWEFGVYYIAAGESSSIDFDKGFYAGMAEQAMITVTDSDLNTNSFTQQTIDISLTSSSDPIGITMTLTEINNDSAIFTSEKTGINLKFSEISSDNAAKIIKVKEADLVIATYNDISPAAIRSLSDLWYSGRAPTDLALGKTAISSSDERAGLEAKYAIDDNPHTRWSSQFSDPQWIQIDLGSEAVVNKAVVNWEVAYAKSYQIQTSGDGINWTDVYYTDAGDGYEDEVCFPSQNARYVRMLGSERATPYSYSLWEIKVFGVIPAGSVSGQVTFQGRIDNSESIVFELRYPGQTIPVKTYQITTTTNGGYVLNNITPGTYDLTAKSANTLRAKQGNISVVDGQTTSNIDFTLLGGDADNNNIVSLVDFAILRAAKGTKPGDANWDPRVDFNANSQIDLTDFAILRSNSGKTGAQ